MRFLELHFVQVEALPDSITDLHCLQTLNLSKCFKLKELPKSIKKMSNRRHLGTENCENLSGMPRGLGILSNLQSLPLFNVSGNQSYGTIAELQSFEFEMEPTERNIQVDALEYLEASPSSS